MCKSSHRGSRCAGLWPWEHDHRCGMFWNLSQEAGREYGNTSQPCGCDDGLFHRVPPPVRALIRSLANMALSTSPTSHLTRLQPRFRSVDFANLCPFLSAGAGVHLIPVATTVQLVLKLGSWGGEVSRSRARQPASVGRQAAGSESACSSETWTSSCQTATMAEDWRSWLTVCLGLEDANWPSTPTLLEPSMTMGQLAREWQTGTEWHSWRRDDVKKPPSPSWLALAADVGWSCWKVKWEARGLLKHEVS